MNKFNNKVSLKYIRFLKNLFIIIYLLFIFGCVGPLFLCEGFL